VLPEHPGLKSETWATHSVFVRVHFILLGRPIEFLSKDASPPGLALLFLPATVPPQLTNLNPIDLPDFPDHPLGFMFTEMRDSMNQNRRRTRKAG
jgi:hypothetical protein